MELRVGVSIGLFGFIFDTGSIALRRGYDFCVVSSISKGYDAYMLNCLKLRTGFCVQARPGRLSIGHICILASQKHDNTVGFYMKCLQLEKIWLASSLKTNEMALRPTC